MKTMIKGILACVLMASLITSCKKKEETLEMNDQSAVSTETPDSTMMALAATDTMANTEMSSTTTSDMQTANGKSSSAGSSANNSSPSNSRGKSAKTKGKDMSGYSAPDGTDAENNDGDQYTKNDKTRMPSGGSSIK